MKRFATLFLALALTGCSARVQHVTNLPPGVTEQQVKNWDAAIADLHKIADTVTTLRQSVIQLNKDGVFPDSNAYALSLTAIGRAAQGEKDATDFLNSVPKNWSLATADKVKAYMGQIQGALDILTSQGITGIKTPNGQTQISNLVTEAIATVNLILSLSASGS